MRTPFIKPIHPFHEDEQTERALQTLDFVEKSGGKRDRWASLIVVSKMLDTIIHIYSLLSGSPTPILQFVSIRWKPHLNIADVQQELALGELRSVGTSLTRSSERLQLHHIKIHGLPKYFMFDGPSPLISNLTKLTFICTANISFPSHLELSAVLAASPRLEHLSLDMRAGNIAFSGFISEPTTIALLQVRLPLLRSFSLDTNDFYQWSLNLLQIVDAPGVEYLNINTDPAHGLSHSTPLELYRYLANGRVNEVLQCHVSLDGITPGSSSIFPLLKHLSTERMKQGPNTSAIFVAFPGVTHVTIGGAGASILCNFLGYLPNVSHITYIHGDVLSALEASECLRRRTIHKTISTLTWCINLPMHETSALLGFKDDRARHLGLEQYYHSPSEWGVDHLIIRQIE
ncbi:unnamed protein product [Rhizoctonia solani]|uniref:Uncharacterized protein n=1 Tax=Rhizoctonia solani TaxID=456999 RepID=A0A8H3A6M8_9AGAM|nr:unnamed protein product [Rhizoctonia solani]